MHSTFAMQNAVGTNNVNIMSASDSNPLHDPMNGS